ncbi:MAG: hypothetical protein Q8Q29_01035, partial [Actinomycetota bacterium]|nr:hypothetical protein [Actinomycetota bacterium]
AVAVDASDHLLLFGGDGNVCGADVPLERETSTFPDPSLYTGRVFFGDLTPVRRPPANSLQAVEAGGHQLWTRAQADGLWVEIDGEDAHVADGNFTYARAAGYSDGSVVVAGVTEEGGACLYNWSDGEWTGPTDLATGLGCASEIDVNVKNNDDTTTVAVRCDNHVSFAMFHPEGTTPAAPPPPAAAPRLFPRPSEPGLMAGGTLAAPP